MDDKIPACCALTAFLLSGCGTHGIKSYNADSKIRADYLADSVRVTFKVIPRCRTTYWFYFWWTERCGEPYAVQVDFAREDMIALNPTPSGTYEHKFEVGLGSGIREKSKTPFRVVLSYKLGNQSGFSEVEKGFEFYERRRWKPLFLK